MPLETLYNQGFGEATIVPQSDAPQRYRDKYLLELQKKKEQEAKGRQAQQAINSFDSEIPWDIDAPDILGKIRAKKAELSSRLGKDINFEDAGIYVDRELRPLAEQAVLSAKQQQDYRRVRQTYDIAKKDTYDNTLSERNMAIYSNPIAWAQKDERVKKELEEAGGDPIRFRAQNDKYLRLPLRYDDKDYVAGLAKGLQSITTDEIVKAADDKGKSVYWSTKKTAPNILGIMSTLQSVETEAMNGDEMAQKFLQYRADAVKNNIDLKEEKGVLKLSSKNSQLLGDEIIEAAKKHFPELISKEETAHEALVKAAGLVELEKYQKNIIDRDVMYKGQNQFNFNVNQSAEIERLGGYRNVLNNYGSKDFTETVKFANGTQGGVTVKGMTSMDNVELQISAGEGTYNATKGEKGTAAANRKVKAANRGVWYVYKPGTKIGGKDVGGTVVPPDREGEDLGKYEAKLMFQASENVKGAYSFTPDVEEKILMPYEAAMGGYYTSLSGNKEKQETEKIKDISLMMLADDENEKLRQKEQAKKKTPAPKQQSAPSKYNKYKR